MGTLKVDRLPREDLNAAYAFDQFIVGQMWVKIERRNIPQKAEAVEVTEGRKRGNFRRALHNCRPEAKRIVNGNT